MRHVLTILFLVAIVALPSRDAEASEWGCEVLLCAASDNPTWHGVSSCHPPMERLIDAMKRPGFSWPTCPEGGAGKPGYDRYAECPAGWAPAVGEQDGNHGQSREMSRCSRTVTDCRGAFGGRYGQESTEVTRDGVTRVYNSRNGCEYKEYVARRLRDQPYYFDIKTLKDGAAERHYFDLNK